jgi:signal peptidase I
MKVLRWILIIGAAAFLALSIRTFLFETIRVASASMSENQPVGNRILIEKWTLGARLPLTIGPSGAYAVLSKQVRRTKGFGHIQRNDILAFNQPDSTQLLDRAPVLVSRCIGLPGEALRMEENRLYINGKYTLLPTDRTSCYSFPLLNFEEVQRLLRKNRVMGKIYQKADTGYVYLTKMEWLRLYREIDYAETGIKARPSGYDRLWIRIPQKGTVIALNDSTFTLYGQLINRYEGTRLRRDTSGVFRSNGKIVRKYRFKGNYYLLLNDHQGFLNDSRTLGLIPEERVIGRAFLVLFSPKEKRFMQHL